MTDQLTGYLLIALSLLLSLMCGASFAAMVLSFTVSNTVTAVESAFGTMVLGILLLVFAKKSYSAGKKRLKSNT